MHGERIVPEIGLFVKGRRTTRRLVVAGDFHVGVALGLGQGPIATALAAAATAAAILGTGTAGQMVIAMGLLAAVAATALGLVGGAGALAQNDLEGLGYCCAAGCGAVKACLRISLRSSKNPRYGDFLRV